MAFMKRKVSKRKATQLVPISCASQKIVVVPMSRPWLSVTKTNVLFVLQQFSSDARGTHMGPVVPPIH
jgi:hypothetical protein